MNVNWFSPAFLTVVVAAGAAILAAFTAISNASKERALSTRQRELEVRREQVSGLYGPLMMWRAVSEQLREILPKQNPDGSRWGLVDHIEDVKRNTDHPEQQAAVDEIIEIGRKVDSLLIDKAGLAWRVPPPPSFSTAVAHSSLLRLFWIQGRNQPKKNRLAFPSEFDDDIKAALKAITRRINELEASIKELESRKSWYHFPWAWPQH